MLGPGGDLRAGFRRAGERLGDDAVRLFELTIDGSRLREIADHAPEEPFVRVVREALGRPVDVEDFLFFLDDLLAVPDLDRSAVWVPSGRARNAGILLHPDDVFAGEPRRYGTFGTLDVSKPDEPSALEPARDGDPVGPRWTARFPHPEDETALLASLERARPGATFATRVRSLLEQLRAQGAECWVPSAERSRERGYLIWGSFLISRAESAAEVRERVALLERRNREWGLDVPILWRHPDGSEATVEAARQMAEAYAVVFATEAGARRSRHYGGRAVDLTAVDLPRRLALQAPDGVTRTFDLSAPENPRDLSLDPVLVDWIERHFDFRKVRSDHPHWEDAAR